MKNFQYDVIILGGGIAGLSSALALAKKKKKVLVIDKKGVRGAASPAAAGILDPLLEFSKGSPMLNLSFPSFKKYPAFLKRIEKIAGKKVDYDKTGMLLLATNKREEKMLQEKYRWHSNTPISLRYLSPEAIKKRAPGVSQKIAKALYYPSVGRVQPENLLKVMRAAALKLGVVLKKSAKSPQVIFSGNRVEGIELHGKNYSGKALIYAMGAWKNRSLKQVKYPVKPVRGQILVLKGPKLSSTILHSAEGMYLVPWRKSQYLLGSTVERVGFKPVVTKAGLSRIRKGIEKIVPEVKRLKIVSKWAGLRPCPSDELPLIGASQIKGLYIASGFFRSGILIGHYAGELLADFILMQKMPKILKPFDPRRFDKSS